MDFKRLLMTEARGDGRQSTRQRGCNAPTFHELINVATPVKSKPEITIDHSVENYRLVYGPGIEYVEQVLSYSRTHSMSRRGVSKLVVDPKNYIRLQHYPTGHSESEVLYDQLLEEGVEVIPLDDVLQHIKRKYPRVMKSLELFKQVPLKSQSGSIVRDEAFSEFFYYVIGEMLPDYAFSRDSGGNLKTVTVTDFRLLSSLFLPASAGGEENTFELITGRFEIYNKKDYFIDSLMDGSALANLIFHIGVSSTSDPSGIRADLKVKETTLQVSLSIGHDKYKWINSAGTAGLRANIINNILDQFLSKSQFFPRAGMTPLGQGRISIDEKSVMTLVELTSDINQDLSEICFYFNIKYLGETFGDHSCLVDYEKLMKRILSLIKNVVGVKYFSPALKVRAERHNVEWKETLDGHKNYYSANYNHSVSWGEDSGLTLTLEEPTISFFAKKREDLQDFIQSFALNSSNTIKAKYVFPGLMEYPNELTVSYGTDYKFPRCLPVMNKSHIHRVVQDGLPELINVQREITASYSPGADYCKPLPDDPLLNYGQFSSSDDCLQAARSAFPAGLISGALDGCTSYLGVAYLVRNPVSRGIQGYAVGGGAGLLLSAVGCGLCQLSDYLRKGTLPGSLWHECATIAGILGMALPFLSGCNVCQYAGGVLGFMVGKYGAETALAVMPPYCVRSKQYKMREARDSSLRESKRPREAESGKTVSREKSLACLISENRGNSADKISNASIQEIANHLKKLKHPIKALPESMLKDLAEMLPWSTPMIGDVIAAYLDTIEDSQARASYIGERLDQCEHYMSEQLPDGLAAAVRQFPGLYLLYFKSIPRSGIDITCVDRVWTVLNRDSPSDLLMQSGKILIENHLSKTDSGAARNVLDDDKLSNKNRLEIFNSLSSAEVLLQSGVIEKLGSAYLERVKLDPAKRKQNMKQHIIKAINIWLKKYSQNPQLTDNLIHLLTDLNRLAGDEDTETLLRFRRTLHERAIIEHSQGNNAQRRLRATAILSALRQER